ncbi:MAG: glycosyltransferase [Kiritimatiellales bacterium]
MNSPAFSVIMPVWNLAHRVTAAVESVLAQTCRDFELILVDDGSADGLESVVRPYLGGKVRLVVTEHRGVSAARNAGIREARGDFIAYLDADNTWRPRFLETIQRALNAPGEYRCVAYAQAEVHAHSGTIHPAGLQIAGEPFSLREMMRRNLIDQNTVVHARRCIDLVGGYDETLRRLVDWDFLVRLTAKFEPVFIPEILVDYNWGLEPYAISQTEDMELATRQVTRTIKARMKNTAAVQGRITIRHDMTDYVWNNVSPEKYDNWLRMSRGPYDMKTFRPCGHPYMLQIEPTSRCNLACPACPVGRDELGRPKQDMTPEQFKSIIDSQRRWLLFAVLWDWGEPFANPQFPAMIRYATDAGVQTVTSTNAHYLGNKDYVKAILNSGLTTLIVAIDSLHDADYRSYRVGGRLERALQGLKTLVDMKREVGSSTLINLRMVVMRHNEKEISKLRRFARKVGADRFTVKTMNPGCGDVALDAERVPLNPKLQRFAYRKNTWDRIPVKAACDRVMTMANIFSNGDVVPCCYDYDSSLKVGNVFETPFTDIWMSPAYCEVRRRIHEERAALPRCRNCHINFQLSKAGWYVEATDLTRLRRPFWDPRRYFFKPENPDANRQKVLMPSAVFPLETPLASDEATGWKPYAIFRGRTRHLRRLACHASSLMPVYTPHPPHRHDEEEILVVLSGEVDLILPSERRRMNAGGFVYYPAGFPHSLEAAGQAAANHLMLKWSGWRRTKAAALGFQAGPASAVDSSQENGGGFASAVCFEGPTGYLKKLQVHLSSIAPGGGYAAHHDDHDVVIIVLEGEVETLGRRVSPHGVIYYAAGEPHGMRNSGAVPARYLVVEFH